MGVSTQTFRSVPVQGAASHTIYNVTSPVTPGDEFSQVLAAGTKQLMVRCRGTSKLQFTFTTGETGVKFITIPRGTTYSAINLELPSTTIYFEADKASQVVEIETWS